MSSARKSRRFPSGWIILILSLALLFVTNPSEQQFTSFLKDKIQKQAEGDETLTGNLTRLLAGPAASLAGMGAVRKDYYLFSTFQLELPGEESLYLGALDHFVKLK
ncbi:MAG: hypothetical protein P1P83_06345 [Bacteroidales bacterium]|nr:hypothetical protein [Bacteroidales bacterium]MDT8373396.1 hypothetical protein [Bacteroidales bacterium]